MSASDFEAWIAPAIEFALAGSLQLALVGIALMLAFRAAMRLFSED